MSAINSMDFTQRLERTRKNERLPYPELAFKSKVERDANLILFYFLNYGSKDAQAVFSELSKQYTTVTENVTIDQFGVDHLTSLTLSCKIASGEELTVTIKTVKDPRSRRSYRLNFSGVKVSKTTQ